MNETIDIDDLVATITTGIYGDDRMNWDTIEAATTALSQLVAEVKRLREHRQLCTANLLKGYETGKTEERAAVVAWLREQANSTTVEVLRARDLDAADLFERGEHHSEE